MLAKRKRRNLHCNIVTDRGGASKDADNRVTKAWSKWREMSGVICDKKIPTKLKLLIYQAVIRQTLLLYGCETWPINVSQR